MFNDNLAFFFLDGNDNLAFANSNSHVKRKPSDVRVQEKGFHFNVKFTLTSKYQHSINVLNVFSLGHNDFTYIMIQTTNH